MHTSKTSPMLKVSLLVGIAIVVFLAFMVYSLQTSIRNSERLTTIKELYFPILERVDANIVRIDKLEERFMQAVMTGEREELEAATQRFGEADTVFGEILSLYPTEAEAIGNLRNALARYFERGRETALALLQRHPDASTGLSQGMNQSLTELRQSVQQFRADSYRQFVETLKASREAATLTLYMGIAVGIMNLFFMAVLVYFIRNNIRMMAVIAEQNATLEQRVTERTAELSRKTSDIHAMLDNMTLGVCTIVPGGLIHPEYSAHLGLIVAQSALAGRNLHEALFSQARLGVDLRDQLGVALDAILGEDRMMFECNRHLLLRDMELEWPDGTRKILQLDWNPITNPADQVEKVLLIVQDVTALRTLEQASARQREELDIIARLIRIAPDRFSDFTASAQRLLKENRCLIETTLIPTPETCTVLFRNMHTVKGNARTFEFNLITDAAHTAEQGYDRLRKDPDAAWEPARLGQELDAVLAALYRYMTISSEQLGRKADGAGSTSLAITPEALAELRQQARCLLTADARPEWRALATRLAALGLVSLQQLIGELMATTDSLARELDKAPPRYRYDGVDPPLPPVVAEALRHALLHLIRNALDHGIEPPAERLVQGKPVEGCLHFGCYRHGQTLELRLGDDGRGLALHKLHAKGVNHGIFQADAPPPNPQQVAGLVFQSGLSTAERVSQISGRGVGLDAARALLREQGGDLDICLLDAPARLDYTLFEFIIHLPESVGSDAP